MFGVNLLWITTTGSPPTPTLLTVISVTSRSVVVSWQIDTSTIPITGYMVRVMAASTSQVIFSDENLSSDNLMLTLRDLQPSTDYQFFINAVNTAGSGEQVSTQFRTITNGKLVIIIVKLVILSLIFLCSCILSAAITAKRHWTKLQ